MMNDSGKTVSCDKTFHHAICMKKISWTAVLAGGLVGVGIAFLLQIFSVAIGLSAFSVNQEGMVAIAIGGLIGIAIGVIAAMFTGGWVAGYLGRPYCTQKNLGVLYGFLAWCVALFIFVIAAGQLGRYVSVYSDFITHPSMVSVTVQPAAPTATPSMQVTTDTQKAAQNLALTTFVVFALFFLGALSCSFGGHCGMNHRCRQGECEVK